MFPLRRESSVIIGFCRCAGMHSSRQLWCTMFKTQGSLCVSKQLKTSTPPAGRSTAQSVIWMRFTSSLCDLLWLDEGLWNCWVFWGKAEQGPRPRTKFHKAEMRTEPIWHSVDPQCGFELNCTMLWVGLWLLWLWLWLKPDTHTAFAYMSWITAI